MTVLYFERRATRWKLADHLKTQAPIRANTTVARAKSILSPFQMKDFAFAYARA